MKVSTKGRYGLRAMVDLAVYSNKDQVSIRNIAERQNISVNYLEQVFSALRKAGLVKSIKGSHGGYILIKQPSEISVQSILLALEGDMDVVDISHNENKEMTKVEIVIERLVWKKINESISNLISGMTLENLADDHKKLQDKEFLMFNI